MNIEEFIKKSEGEWRSMRSGHSMAFQQFEEIVSKIKIKILPKTDKEVIHLLESNNSLNKNIGSPFVINWNSESDWDVTNGSSSTNGSSILIPIPESAKEGLILRSLGYAEKIKVSSKYKFLCDGTLILSTKYTQTIAEERIWFASDNVRFRSSVVRSTDSSAILQSSHASELRKLNL